MGTKHIQGEMFINDRKVLTDGSETITLSASKWSSDKQVITIYNLTPSSLVFVSPYGDPKAYTEAGIYCSEQADNSLTFSCENTPTTDIEVNILIMG